MIVFFGISGSGKGTQAELLAKKLGCPIVTTGDILRRNGDNPQIKAATDAGQLVPDDITLGLLDAELARIEADKKEFILDGSPRSVRQSQWLDEKIKSGQAKLTALVNFKLTSEEALKRLKLRARHDDTDQSINQRFNFYLTSVIPALEYLKKQGYKLVDIDGNQPVEKVAEDITKALGVE